MSTGDARDGCSLLSHGAGELRNVLQGLGGGVRAALRVRGAAAPARARAARFRRHARRHAVPDRARTVRARLRR
jgi:hypothetical protein